MKKFAAIILSALIVLSMAAIGISSVSAEAIASDGVLNVYKKSNTEAAEGQTENFNSNPNDPQYKKGLNGAVFRIYKVFEKTTDGYVLQDDFKTVLQNYTGNLTKAKDTDDTYVTYGSTDALTAEIGKVRAVAGALAADKYTEETTATVSGTDGVAVFNELPYGVYLVVENKAPDGYIELSEPFFVNISSSTPVNTYPKNKPFELTKEIGDTASSKTTASYSIGDTVPYIVRTKTPNYNKDTLTGIYSTKHELDTNANGINDYNEQIPYYFTDTLSKGLTLVLGDGADDAAKLKAAFTVTINSFPFTDFSVTKGETAGDGSIPYTIKFDFDKIYKPNTATDPDPSNEIDLLDKDVVITYNATLNENAKVLGDAAGTANNNDIDLYFKNDPSTMSDPVKYDPKDNPEVFTYEMNLTKKLNGKTFSEASFDSEKDTKPKFKLYTDIGTTKKGVKASLANDVYTVTNDDASNTEITELELTNTGTLKVRGLAAGEYYLEEVGAPVVGSNNYTPLTSYIKITVSDTVVDGKITGAVNASINNGNGQQAVTNTANTGSFSFEVNNPLSQFNLPETGGYGILIFTLGGAVVLAAAIIIFTIARKKKETK